MLLNGRRLSPLLICTALFAALWAIARAAIQAVTIDEADSYLAFVRPHAPLEWYPSANNHVLNSLLTRLFTAVFGLSHLSLRAPALIGAVIYISAALWLVVLIHPKLSFRWPLLACLVFNPFVFDYLVAARGYSLAVAFLLCAIVIPIHFFESERLAHACALSSACAGLSVAANFSFGFVNAAVILALLIWAAYKRSAKMAAASILPAVLLTLCISAPALPVVHKFDFVYGATSLSETLQSITSASLYELNPNLANPVLLGPLESIQRFLLPLTAAFCLLQLGILVWNRSNLREACARRLSLFGAVLISILIVTVALHWLSFELFHLLLPKDRTALYFVPLATLVAGILVAVPLPSRLGRTGRIAVLGSLYALSGYYLLCLRLNYFKEWRFDADVKSVYSVLAYYNHKYGIRNVATNWMYSPSLNFYRELSGGETLAEFRWVTPYPTDRMIYVLYGPADSGFIAEQKLKVVYQGEISGAVVAIRPDMDNGGNAAHP